MGFKNSKSFKILKEEGIYQSCVYILGKSKFLQKIRNKTLPMFDKLFILCLLYVYPKIALSAKQYPTFIILKNRFINNYKEMIIANPIFFAKNLKKHIEWLESDTFKKEYIDTITRKYNIKFDSMHDFINFTPPPPQIIKLHKTIGL